MKHFQITEIGTWRIYSWTGIKQGKQREFENTIRVGTLMYIPTNMMHINISTKFVQKKKGYPIFPKDMSRPWLLAPDILPECAPDNAEK